MVKNNLTKYLCLFGVGAFLYCFIEILWRGRTHWSMAIVGGLCFILIGLINNVFTFEMPLYQQCTIAMIVVTILEFISGCILNLWLGWDVWHYKTLSLLGQISLPASIGWFFLSSIGIFLDDCLRWKWFGEEKPYYKFF